MSFLLGSLFGFCVAVAVVKRDLREIRRHYRD